MQGGKCKTGKGSTKISGLENAGKQIRPTCVVNVVNFSRENKIYVQGYTACKKSRKTVSLKTYNFLTAEYIGYLVLQISLSFRQTLRVVHLHQTLDKRRQRFDAEAVLS